MILCAGTLQLLPGARGCRRHRCGARSRPRVLAASHPPVGKTRLSDDLSELRLSLEGVTCDLLFFEHLFDGVAPEDVRIYQELHLGPNAFADIEVIAGLASPY